MSIIYNSSWVVVRVVALGLGVRSNHGLQPSGKIVLALGLHKRPLSNLQAHISLLCSCSSSIAAARMPLLLLLL